MASSGQLQMMSCFTLLLGLLLVAVAVAASSSTVLTSSSIRKDQGEAAATTRRSWSTNKSTKSSSASSSQEIEASRRSMISWTWPWELPKDWFNRSLKDMLYYLNKIRNRIIDEMLKILGLPPTGDILHYLLTAAKWLGEKLYYFLSDPRARIDTVMNWIVDSALNPFRTLTDGMRSFERLFRYLHKLKKGSYIDFGKDNPVYKCYREFWPGCTAMASDAVDSRIIYHFYCAWMFYERCQLHWWWKNGKWNVPNINGGDPCKVLPKGKCADDPPL